MIRLRIPALAFLAASGLAGCDSPSPAFSGREPDHVTIDGATYAVRHTATAAEAVRLGRDRSPRRGAAVTKGALAILKASGCAIRRNSLRGDAALVVAELDCGGDAPPASASGAGLDCGFIPGIFDRDDWRGASIDCVVIPE